MKPLLALVLAAAMLGAQDKTYDLKRASPLTEGQRTEKTQKEFIKVVVMVNGRVTATTEIAKDLAASENVLSVDKDKVKRRWIFSKATLKEGGKGGPYTFQGKSVILAQSRWKDPVFSLEGPGELTEPDISGLMSFGDMAKGGGDSGGGDLFDPDKPVKSGETWKPDLRKLAAALLGSNLAKCIDVASSKLSFTLKSVEMRDGVEFGKTIGTMELAFVGVGDVKFDQAMPMKFTFESDSCIDGKLPDFVMKLKGDMKGRRTISTAQGQSDVEVDFVQELTKTVKSAK